MGRPRFRASQGRGHHEAPWCGALPKGAHDGAPVFCCARRPPGRQGTATDQVTSVSQCQGLLRLGGAFSNEGESGEGKGCIEKP